MLDSRSGPLFRDAAAVAVIDFRGSSRGGGGGQAFDTAERLQVAMAIRNAEVGANLPEAVRGLNSGIALSVNGAPLAPQGEPYPPPTAPVRVGGNIKQPAKIADAAPVWPAVARQAGIAGVVIVEVVIGPDGSVKDAKVLREIVQCLSLVFRIQFLAPVAALTAQSTIKHKNRSYWGEPRAIRMNAWIKFLSK